MYSGHSRYLSRTLWHILPTITCGFSFGQYHNHLDKTTFPVPYNGTFPHLKLIKTDVETYLCCQTDPYRCTFQVSRYRVN